MHTLKMHFCDDGLKPGRMSTVAEAMLRKVATSVGGSGFFCFSIRILILLVLRWVSRRVGQETEGGWGLRRLDTSQNSSQEPSHSSSGAQTFHRWVARVRKQETRAPLELGLGKAGLVSAG